MSDLTGGSVVVAADAQVSCDLDGEAAILNTATGVYYGLDEVAATIWKHMQTPTAVDAICAALVNDYEVDADTAKTDLVAFLNEMLNEGLVEVLPESRA